MTHVPVLLKEVIKVLDPKPGEFFVDGTLGAGGHARAIIERTKGRGLFLGIDWDEKALEAFRPEVASRGNVILAHGNYAEIPELLKKLQTPKIDGLVLDLGLSSDQLESSGRGFSFMRNEPLDMRYNRNEEERPTAAQVVNSFSEEALTDIIFKYGEEKFARRIAKKIVERRRETRIMTTEELVRVIESAVPGRGKERIHPATRAFQALRIYVNGELQNLESILKSLPDVMEEGGRATVISFHSLEDRLVKNAFRELVLAKKADLINKKPISPGPPEIRGNPRSRSAKLRAIRFK
ncbi:16S rRNA (cytosine(1402)-N(4))-methyltransferase RsmH [Patescibacteria group bacterium]|nr:16S rRNA (cytosine(1402)-N(4))-methyltransferase RsmH [Patescibacteria group bacterium]